MSNHVDKKSSILIIGAGCFGLSTAHVLAKAGYTNITVLDRDDEVPSRFSAADDLNKVVRAEYADQFYTDLALEAIRRWQSDPLYKPNYRQTGFLNVTSAAGSQLARDVVEKYQKSLQLNPNFNDQVSRVTRTEDVRRLVPAFSGPVAGWTGYFNKLAGYAHSANALVAEYNACVKLGVKFHLGSTAGEVNELLYDLASNGRICIGAKTAGGKVYHADKTILALGAEVARLLPQIGKQVTGRCWGVVHIQLTPEEAASLESIPVTNVRDLAFFFEPDRKTNKLKFCHMGGGYTHTRNGVSLPYSSLAESQFVPDIDEHHIRQLLREVLPQFADRPLVDQHLCWFADTADSDFIIDFVPGTNSTLAVLSGDSGHGLKFLPTFGEFARELLEKGKPRTPKWEWKDGTGAQGVNWRGDARGRELSGVVRAKL
ncbi:FAD dependent oxidoreductase [Lophiostoma macrostomum CBS 122681]|uniref:FAD dependent oxidoreductase n=1 Tax=Lophiostoma macrostomum CBS 122681 TaxID=1314788 RepID=A0A6A6STJ2_9PLEO|nr:FAD dependent oxidoreductase [Lophiostoma macrostomum CBS 122681]